ncbi:MAG: threonine aldolase family protein [Longimicrobiales bacterium]
MIRGMDPVSRRAFVESLGVTAAAGWMRPPLHGFSGGAPALSPDRVVRLTGDGLGLAPRAYASLLADIAQRVEIVEDDYLLGGEIERFEHRWAELLGKERAVFMPSGTLANQLALRALAGQRRRVIVPETSHIYNDTGDASQTLSGLTLIPLGPGNAAFTCAEVEAVLTRTSSGRVQTEVGAIAVESPVRRLKGQLFDWEEMRRLSAFARGRGIGLHLDGARLFIASAYTGVSPAQYAALFDTVYVSLWKYFNSGIGAILAGPRSLLDGMFHVRRMFGGNLAVGWPAALVATHYMDGFLDRLRAAVRVSEDFYAAIGHHASFSVERVPSGTNLAQVTVKTSDRDAFARRLEERGVLLPEGGTGPFTLAVNETWTRTSAAELTQAFEQSAI